MKVTIKALGTLRSKVPEERDFEVENPGFRLGELVKELTEIPETESRLSYVVNGKIQKADYHPQDGDHILLLKMGGAG